MHLLVYLGVLIATVTARLCVDNTKGYCRGHEIWGWCFHNKTSQRFDCDEGGYCVGQDSLKNKKSSGCFNRDNNTVCCCNDVDGCNLGFLSLPPKLVGGQSCYNTIEEPNEEPRLFKNCDDPWCYAFLNADAEGGLTSVQRGCHSRKMVIHHMFLDEDKKFHNNTRWKDTEVLASQPTCHELAMDASAENGTQSICYDFNYETDGIEKKGRICCCRGGARCNEKFAWGDPGITIVELEELREKRNRALTGQSPEFVSKSTLLLVTVFNLLRSMWM